MSHPTRTEYVEFERLLAQYSSLINKVCYFYATNSEDFEDMRQEALVNIWRSLDRFRGEASRSTWIYRIVINSCVSFFRSTRKHNVQSVVAADFPELMPVDDEKGQMLREMYDLINRLDDVDKAIVLMWLDGNSYEEIAAVVGLRTVTVGTRLHRIKDKLVKLSNE